MKGRLTRLETVMSFFLEHDGKGIGYLAGERSGRRYVLKRGPCGTRWFLYLERPVESASPRKKSQTDTRLSRDVTRGRVSPKRSRRKTDKAGRAILLSLGIDPDAPIQDDEEIL